MTRALVAPVFAFCAAARNGDAKSRSIAGRWKNSGPVQANVGVGPRTSRRTRRVPSRRHVDRVTHQDATADDDDVVVSSDFHDPPTPNDWSVPGGNTGGWSKNLGVVLTHVSADFDTLSSAVGLAKLRNHQLNENCTFVVLPRGASPGVAHFVQLHKNKFPIREKKAFPFHGLKWVGVVDAQRKDRLADCAAWLDIAKIVVVLDHHVLSTSDIDATELIVENVGATATVVAEMLQVRISHFPNSASLIAQTTLTLSFPHLFSDGKRANHGGRRDVVGAWNSRRYWLFDFRKHHAEGRESAGVLFRERRVTESLGGVLQPVTHRGPKGRHRARNEGRREHHRGRPDNLSSARGVPGVHPRDGAVRQTRLTLSFISQVDLASVLRQTLKGGGHPKAASAAFRMDQSLLGSGVDADAAVDASVTTAADVDAAVRAVEDARIAGSVEGILDALVQQIVTTQIPPQKTAKDVMRKADKVISAHPSMTMGDLGALLERYDHRSCPVISQVRIGPFPPAYPDTPFCLPIHDG
jgi:hypothetical protein